jgi:hypothetical protein
MKLVISQRIKDIAKLLESDENDSVMTPGLSDQEQRLLPKNGKKLLEQVKKNIERDIKPYFGLSIQDKIQLLAFVVYSRQNPDKSSSSLNDEDASQILKSGIYVDDPKKLDTDLSKQLIKGFGLKINKD